MMTATKFITRSLSASFHSGSAKRSSLFEIFRLAKSCLTTILPLVAGKITFAQVGPLLEAKVVSLPYRKATFADGAVSGTLPLVDFHFGNLWTNIPDSIFEQLAPKYGDLFLVIIARDGREAYRGVLPYVRTFADVPAGEPLLYINSLLDIAFAINLGSFAKTNGLDYGGEWTVEVRRSR